MKILGVLFGLFVSGQGVRAVLNGHMSLGCLAIAAGLIMLGAVLLIAARADAAKKYGMPPFMKRRL